MRKGQDHFSGKTIARGLTVAFTSPKWESWSGEAQLTEPISQRTEELSYTLVSYLKLFNVFNPTLHTLGVSLNELLKRFKPTFSQRVYR